MKQEAAHGLAERIASGRYSPEELHLFLAYLSTAGKAEAEGMVETYLSGLDKYPDEKIYVRPDFLDRVTAALSEEIHNKGSAPATTTITRSIRRPVIWPMAAAILCLVLLFWWLYPRLFPRRAETPLQTPKEMSNGPMIQSPPTTDTIPVRIMPRNSVILTNSGGEKIVLDSNRNQVLQEAGGNTIYINGNYMQYVNKIQ